MAFQLMNLNSARGIFNGLQDLAGVAPNMPQTPSFMGNVTNNRVNENSNIQPGGDLLKSIQASRANPSMAGGQGGAAALFNPSNFAQQQVQQQGQAINPMQAVNDAQQPRLGLAAGMPQNNTNANAQGDLPIPGNAQKQNMPSTPLYSPALMDAMEGKGFK